MTRTFRVGYLVSCQGWYWKPIEALKLNWWERNPIQMSRLIWVYGYGARKGYIDITFEWFKKIILDKLDPEAQLYPIVRHYKPWGHYTPTVNSKYRKGEDHGIKDRDRHEAKKLWRDHSGKARDRRARSWKRGPSRFWKRYRSKTHRSWVRQQLVRDDYDQFHKKEREEQCDSWCWD